MSISYIGRVAHSGLWTVPNVGSQIVVSSDDINLTNLFWIQTDSVPSTGGTSGPMALTDLTDVTVTSPLVYQTLEYNGTEWVNAEASVATYVRNAESTTLNVGEVVYLYQQQGDRASVKRAYNTNDGGSAKTLGVVATSIPPASDGVVVTQGYVYGCNLGSYTAGQTVYLGETAGTITATKPYAPNHLVYVGVVVRANNGNGIIYVRAQNGYELDEIHDVSVQTRAANESLVYNGSLWVNSKIALGTNTTGDYVSSLVAGTGITITNNSGEGATPTVALSDVVTNVQTATYTLALSDKNKMIEMNVGSANILYVPTDASVNFPIGSTIDVLQTGTGKTQIAAVSSGTTTINSANGFYLRAQWSSATLIKRAANTWVVVGDLSTS